MIRFYAACVAALTSFLSAVTFAGEPTLRIGAAQVDITPPAGMPFQVPQVPPYPVIAAEGAHDPLQAKAVVFESGDTRAAIVACDLTSIPLEIITAARKHVGAMTRVPPENVMISATHTHTVPNIRPRFFKTAKPEQMKIALDYLERLPRLIAESVKQAETKLTVARLQAAQGEVHGVAFNRRFLMKEGVVVSNPGKGQDELLANVVRPAGPTDPSLPLIYFDTPKGEPLASMVNFSMHLDTTGGLRYSADYPHVIARILADVKGPAMLTHFTTGACGNINHYYLLDPKKPRRVKGYDEAARIGTLLAAEVVRTYERLRPLATAPLKVSREIVTLKMLKEKSDKFIADDGPRPSFFDGEVTERLVNGQYVFEAEVMVITLGDEVAIVGVPGELFVELGLTIKQGSPYQYTIIDELANGAIGYIPNRKAQAEGAYGASVQSTRCDPGSGEALVDSAIRQLIAHRAIVPTLR
jgi:neutral ceramidase